jgi:GAF domain-containing protein
MVDAALGYGGAERLAELASAQVARPVAIVVPERGIATAWMAESPGHVIEALQSYEQARASGNQTDTPTDVELIMPIKLGGVEIGVVAMLHGEGPARVEAAEVLHLAALATVTSIALEDAREEESSAQLADGLIEEIRRSDTSSPELTRRAWAVTSRAVLWCSSLRCARAARGKRCR